MDAKGPFEYWLGPPQGLGSLGFEDQLPAGRSPAEETLAPFMSDTCRHVRTFCHIWYFALLSKERHATMIIAPGKCGWMPSDVTDEIKESNKTPLKRVQPI